MSQKGRDRERKKEGGGGSRKEMDYFFLRNRFYRITLNPF